MDACVSEEMNAFPIFPARTCKKYEFQAERGKRKLGLFYFSVGIWAMTYRINIFVFSLAIIMHQNLNFPQSLHLFMQNAKTLRLDRSVYHLSPSFMPYLFHLYVWRNPQDNVRTYALYVMCILEKLRNEKSHFLFAPDIYHFLMFFSPSWRSAFPFGIISLQSKDLL